MLKTERTPRTLAGSLLAALALLTVGAACSSTSGNDALNQITNAFCTRATACCSALSNSNCQTYFTGAYVRAGFDTSANYTTDSVNACSAAFTQLACPTSGCSFTVPSACPGAGGTLTVPAADLGDGGSTTTTDSGTGTTDSGTGTTDMDSAAAAD